MAGGVQGDLSQNIGGFLKTSRVRKIVLTMRYRTTHDCRLRDGPRSPETQKEFYYYLRVNQSV